MSHCARDWDRFSEQTMREAAKRAGLPSENDRLILALEPEAAAHYARVSGLRTTGLSGGRATLMSPRSRFMVVDCGGGTVDITSYRADTNNNLEEIGNDCGGPYGSDYLNRAFVEEVLLSRFSSWNRMRELATTSPAAFASLIESWEKEKTYVEFPVTGEIYIPMPAALHRTLTSDDLEVLGSKQNDITDMIVVTEEETSSIFDNLVANVLQLVDKQLTDMSLQRRSTKGDEIIVLVGGFGASKYLQKRLQEHVSSRASVIIPPDPGAAVLEGAVHYAYDPQIRARKTKLTYGVNTGPEFVVGLDPESKRFIDEFGVARCHDRFNIFVNAQEVVRVDRCVSQVLHPVNPTQSQTSMEIYASKKLRPRYVDEEQVIRLGEIYVDLAGVMKEKFEDRSVKVSMFFGETEIRVQATVEMTGEVLHTNIKFEAQDWE